MDDCKYCGNCKHWHEWDNKRIAEEEEKSKRILGQYYEYYEYTLKQGDCDKIPKGEVFHFTLSDGTEHEATYGGYSFEDECYDEYFNCYEEND